MLRFPSLVSVSWRFIRYECPLHSRCLRFSLALVLMRKHLEHIFRSIAFRLEASERYCRNGLSGIQFVHESKQTLGRHLGAHTVE